ncbi:hypothetical protein HAX54_029434, partial [Datura stramonium]|nr:hypothetical protein [Datura stramonium]
GWWRMCWSRSKYLCSADFLVLDYDVDKDIPCNTPKFSKTRLRIWNMTGKIVCGYHGPSLHHEMRHDTWYHSDPKITHGLTSFGILD